MTDNYKADQDRFFEDHEATVQERERRATARANRRAAELEEERGRKLRAERARERAAWLAANPDKTWSDYLKLKYAESQAELRAKARTKEDEQQ